MRLWPALSCLALVSASAVVALGGTSAAGTASAPEELYFGRTTRGEPVQFAVRGPRFRKSASYVAFRCGRSDPIFFPQDLRWPAFRGDRAVLHRVVHLGGGDVEQWFRARRVDGGRTIAGTFREQNRVYQRSSWCDTGTIRFSTRRWASTSGAEWTGTTADGRPLTLSISYRLVPGTTIVNGVRVRVEEFTFTVPELSRSLACRDAQGAAFTVDADVPGLSGPLDGHRLVTLRPPFRFGYPGLKSPAGKPGRASVTTAAGITVRAEATIRRLGVSGARLTATGALALDGASADGARCERTTTAFTLRPR